MPKKTKVKPETKAKVKAWDADTTSYENPSRVRNSSVASVSDVTPFEVEVEKVVLAATKPKKRCKTKWVLCSIVLLLLLAVGAVVYKLFGGTPDPVGSINNNRTKSNDASKTGSDTAGIDTTTTTTTTTESPTTAPSCETISPIATPSTTLLPNTKYRFPIATSKNILILEINGKQYLARSYDTNQWEPSPNAIISFDCCANYCTGTLPATTGTYSLYNVPASHLSSLSTSNSAVASRFLTQASFGPTLSEINTFSTQMESSTSVFKTWVQEQMALPPSLHRAYYRRRANPRLFKGLVMPTGQSRAPCSKGSRWRRYAFDDNDRTKDIKVENSAAGIVTLSIDGTVRSVVPEATFALTPSATVARGTFQTFKICKNQPGSIGSWLQEWTNGDLLLDLGGDCSSSSTTKHTAKNVAIQFGAATPPATLQTFTTEQLVLTDVQVSWSLPTDVIKRNDVLLESVTVNCIAGLDHIQIENNIWKRDYRMEMVENTLTAPADSKISHATMSGTCPSVPPTFVNRKTCVRRPSCAPLTYTSTMITLNRTTLRSMYERSGKLIYVVEGLRLESTFNNGLCMATHGHHLRSGIFSNCDPCVVSKSRWLKSTIPNGGACLSSTTMDAGTKSTIAAAITASTDSNPNVMDINLKSASEGGVGGGVCLAAAAFGGTVEAKGSCWTHVHPHLFTVIDATYWNEDHSGNKKDDLYYPIKSFALQGLTTLQFPASHPMSRWNKDTVQSFTYKIKALGRLDDVVDFKSLPVETQDIELGKLFNAIGSTATDGSHLACGSPGEVANDPVLGHKFGILLTYVDNGQGGSFDPNPDVHGTEVKRTVWTMLALKAPDQLRQKVAWALAQTFVISEIGDLDVKRGQKEVWFAYYDIFVRHGFGNYFDILKEVAYSPMMGTYLTFKGSKSVASDGLPADENFARESMQLLTVGLFKLNIDGTFKLDELGEKIPTYSNKNIQSFARIWTGFTQQTFRGNIEGHRGIQSSNYLDPMRVIGAHHDVLPKLGLDDNYLGDGVQLCVDVPSKSFFRKGARFINIGNRPPSDGTIPGDLDPTKTNFKYGPNVHHQFTPGPTGSPFTSIYKRLVPDPSASKLYGALCGNQNVANTKCTFASEVTLDTDITCHGRECRLDRELIYIQIIDSVTSEIVFYQFDKPLCVQFPFYKDPKLLAHTHNGNKKTCANPLEAKGGAVCCMTPQVGGYFGFDTCEYHLEMVTFDKANERCEGFIQDTTRATPPGPYNFGRFADWVGYDKTPTTRTLEICKKRDATCLDSMSNVDVLCTGQDQTNCPTTNAGNGDKCVYTASASRLGLRTLDGCGYNYRSSWLDETCKLQVQIDRFGRLSAIHDGSSEKEVQLNSGNQFYVHWNQDIFPLATDNCVTGTSETTCEVQGKTCLCDIDVQVTSVFSNTNTFPSKKEILSKLKIGAPSISQFSSGTYIKCVTKICIDAIGIDVWLKGSGTVWNQDTIFYISNLNSYRFNRLSTVHIGTTHSFRNVPHFISLKYASSSDMVAEIEAMINMLLTHDNTAPFLASKMIKHLVTSNPSPRYIQVVATAFQTGTYDGIGSGKYGDMAAMVSAILLDKEARNTVLDAAPTFGRVREPLSKVMHVMRSLEFTTSHQNMKEIVLKNTLGKIGVAPYQSPSVFNFYLPDFISPDKKLGTQYGLTSPEMGLGTAPFLLGFLNGMSSMIDRGLTSNHFGFGTSHDDSLKTFTGSTPLGVKDSKGKTATVSSLGSLRDGTGSPADNGMFKFAPVAAVTNAEAVISELDLLLTNGRLDDHSRTVIVDAYQERLTTPPAATLPTGVVLQLHPTDYGCLTQESAGRFRVTLQETVLSGAGENNIYLRNDRNDGQEILTPRVIHWSWSKMHMYIKKVDGVCDCTVFEAMFNPNDVVLVSKSSLVELPDSAMRLAQTLLISSAEFHTTAVNARSTIVRNAPPSVQTQNRPYKAIVVVFMSGGVDSWNMLMPHSGCKNPEGNPFDLFNEYSTQRGAAAMRQADMKQITSPNNHAQNTQPCTTFGVNPGLTKIQELYNAGDANFIANVGTLVEPLNRDDYVKKLKRYPGSLFAHNSQQTTAKTVHAGAAKSKKGVLGRIVESLTHQTDPYAAAAYSMNGVQDIFRGNYPPFIVGRNGVDQYVNGNGQLKHVEHLLHMQSEHGFAESYSHLLNRSIVDSKELGNILSGATKKASKFGSSSELKGNRNVELQMKNVANVILARGDTKNEREVFYIQANGFDSHFQALKPGNEVYERLQSVNNAVSNFADEMKAEGIWNNVVVVSESDFGRKIVPNGGGTDHGWGGHTFIAGGGIKGGQILGTYPDRLDESSAQNIYNSNGRFIPTTPLEAIWKPIAKWFGVVDEKMGDVLPNDGNFGSGYAFEQGVLFD